MRRLSLALAGLSFLALIVSAVGFVAHGVVDMRATDFPEVVVRAENRWWLLQRSHSGLSIPLTDRDAYAVYKAAIAALLGPGTKVIFEDNTRRPEVEHKYDVPAVPDEWQDAAQDFYERNLARWILQDDSVRRIGPLLWIIDVKKEFERSDLFFVRLDARWQHLLDLHAAKGVVSASAVGFSADKTRAFLSLSFASTHEPFGVVQMALRRTHDKWTRVDIPGLYPRFNWHAAPAR